MTGLQRAVACTGRLKPCLATAAIPGPTGHFAAGAVSHEMLFPRPLPTPRLTAPPPSFGEHVLWLCACTLLGPSSLSQNLHNWTPREQERVDEIGSTLQTHCLTAEKVRA